MGLFLLFLCALLELWLVIELMVFMLWSFVKCVVHKIILLIICLEKMSVEKMSMKGDCSLLLGYSTRIHVSIIDEKSSRSCHGISTFRSLKVSAYTY